MGYRVVIIGLGVIARHHAMALLQTERFCLCGVCDLREEAAHNDLYRGLPFYRDYEALLAAVRPDIAIIATPPATHYSIARSCVAQGVLPIVEKPLAATGEEGRLFFSEAMRDKYIPVCHTLYGAEMLWMAEHLPLTRISSIRMELCDPYADASGHIAGQYIPLGGSWLDSAPNALAPLLNMVPSLTDISVSHLRDAHSGLPYSSSLTARHEDTEIAIDIAWHRGISNKQTEIHADGRHVLLDHSAQSVTIDAERVFKADGERLTRQYTNFYQLYPAGIPTEEKMKYMYQIIYGHLI